MEEAIQDQAFGIIPLLRGSSPHHQYLLIQHKKGHWGFPKGHADPGESPEQTAQREFQEETGLQTRQIFPKLKFTERYQFLKRKKGRWVHKTVIYFVGEVDPTPQGEAPKAQIQPEEISDFRWCSLSEALLLLSYEAGRQMLRDCEGALAS